MKQRTGSRLAWTVWFFAVALGVSALILLVLNDPERGVWGDAAFFGVFLAMTTVGALVVSRQPRNAVGWLFLAMGATAALAFAGDEYAHYAVLTRPGSLPGAEWGAWLGDLVWVSILGMAIVLLPLLFPDGRLPSPSWRPFLWLSVSFLVFVLLVFAFDPGLIGPSRSVQNPLGVEGLNSLAVVVESVGYFVVLGLGVLSVISLILRFRRADRAQRQQIKWFVFAAAIFTFTFVLEVVVQLLHLDGGVLIDQILPTLAFMALPIGAGIGILKYRLFDIDLVINRAVLYGVLAVFITAVYVAIVVGVGTVVGSRGNLFLSIVATAAVALAFQPVRGWARHVANRLVYGKRATPYEVLSEFSEQLGDAYSTDAVLPRMAGMIGEATGAERAAVWVRVGDEFRQAAGWPEERGMRSLRAEGDELPGFPDGERAFAVRHQGELLGALSLATSRREPLNPTQEKLIEDLAGQAGLILRNVRLIAELRASRQRIVAAQDEERRRLERNIHDGAQQQLVALAVRLRLVESLALKDATKAAEMAAQAKAETQEALDNLRDLARGIYPPLLADRGLAAALDAQARKASVPIEITTDGIGRYSQEAEAAVYFCVLEALQNVAKYAGASRVTVRLRVENGDLAFAVEDDGAGFDRVATPRGSGLQNMADRLEAVGGSLEIESTPGAGTTVSGQIPVQPRAAAQASESRSGSNSDLGM